MSDESRTEEPETTDTVVTPARPRPRPRPSAGPVEVSLDKPAEEDEKDEPTPDETPKAATPWAERVPWLVAGVALAAAWVMVALCLWLSHGVWWGKDGVDQQKRQAVLAAAKSCIADTNSYDYTKLDEARARALACTTGSFTTTYGKAFDGQVVAQAKAVRAVQKLEVLSAGVSQVSPSGDQWDVLVYAQITATNVQYTSDAPQVTLLSAVVTMERAGGKWLISAYKTAP